MKNKSFVMTILLLIMSFFMVTSQAKEAKVRYSKFVEYRGEVSQKQPSGAGTLTVYSRVNKKEPLLVLEGNFEPRANNTLFVTKAKLTMESGVIISSNDFRVYIKKLKDEEGIDFRAPGFKISHNQIEIEDNSNLSFSLNWTKRGDKEWEFSTFPAGKGVIKSNLLPVGKEIDRVNSLNINPIQQKVAYRVLQQYPICTPTGIYVGELWETLFDTGLTISLEVGKTTYLFPNGNIVVYKGGELDNASMTLSDGRISTKGSRLKLAYQNGDTFEGPISSVLTKSSSDILPRTNSLKDLELQNGDYHHAGNKTTDTYSNGIIVARKLSDGSISMGRDGQYSIRFNNGKTFKGKNKYFIANSDNFLKFKSVSEAVLNNGILEKSAKEWGTYKDGKIIGGQWKLADGGYVEYSNNAPIKLTYPDGEYIANAEFEKNHPYSPSLKSSDFVIKNGKVNLSNGEHIVFNNGQAKPKTREDVEFLAKSKGFKSVKLRIGSDECSLDAVEGNPFTRTITLTDYLPHKEVSQLNNTDYYIRVGPNYRFSWPKSFVTEEKRYYHVVVKAESMRFNKRVGDFSDYRSSPSVPDRYMIWVYKPVLEKDGVTYGQTKGLYIFLTSDDAGGEGKKIVYDLSETFTNGNNRSFKKVPAPQKKNIMKEEELRIVEYALVLVEVGKEDIAPSVEAKVGISNMNGKMSNN